MQAEACLPQLKHAEANVPLLKHACHCCRPLPVYAIIVDQFLNVPFPDWFYSYLVEKADAWGSDAGRLCGQAIAVQLMFCCCVPVAIRLGLVCFLSAGIQAYQQTARQGINNSGVLLWWSSLGAPCCWMPIFVTPTCVPCSSPLGFDPMLYVGLKLMHSCSVWLLAHCM